MCDAEYINKKQLKLIKFEKLLKKWDNIHYYKTFSPYINEWEYESKEYNRNKFRDFLVKKLDTKKGKSQFRNNIISHYINELNKVPCIKGIKKNTGYWYCYVEFDELDFMGKRCHYDSDIIAEEGSGTFREFKMYVIEEFYKNIDYVLENNTNYQIAEDFSRSLYSDIKCIFKIEYKVFSKESYNYYYDDNRSVKLDRKFYEKYL